MTEDKRIARAAIQQRLAQLVVNGDTGDAEGYAGCFTEAGVLDMGVGEPLSGRAAILAQRKTRPAGVQTMMHHLTTCHMVFDEPTQAEVRTYWLLIDVAGGIRYSGYYDDCFEHVGDEWLVSHRRAKSLWANPATA
jgi:SnoaL-like domain